MRKVSIAQKGRIAQKGSLARQELSPESRLPRRFLVAAALTLLPLFLFGGTVTTIGAGLAVEGWWNAEGHFMPLFPIAKWFRDLHTFVEHSHRQFGLVIGCFMLAALVAAFFGAARRRPARWLVLFATVAVVFQGWLGGSRVLERSPEFAFLHGAFAQLVFATILAAALLYSHTWTEKIASSEPASSEPASGEPVELPGMRLVAFVVASLVYAQILLGAFYRHGLRNALHGEETSELVFGMHFFGGLVVFFAITALSAHLARAESVTGNRSLGRLRKRQITLLFAQIFLGAGAWVSFEPEFVPFAEWAFATAHVLVGALLFATAVQAAMWAVRLTGTRGQASAPAAELDGTPAPPV